LHVGLAEPGGVDDAPVRHDRDAEARRYTESERALRETIDGGDAWIESGVGHSSCATARKDERDRGESGQ
jgi:hypothetical protein